MIAHYMPRKAGTLQQSLPGFTQKDSVDVAVVFNPYRAVFIAPKLRKAADEPHSSEHLRRTRPRQRNPLAPKAAAPGWITRRRALLPGHPWMCRHSFLIGKRVLGGISMEISAAYLLPCTLSCSKSQRLRSIPPPYPVSEPLDPITR